jgi:hypothetical protein
MPDLASKRQFDVEYSHTLTATGEKFDYAIALSQDSEGLRPIHLAAQKGHREVVSYDFYITKLILNCMFTKI